IPPEISSAPQTRPRISRKYLRKSWPRSNGRRAGCVAACCCSAMGSTSFRPFPPPASLYHRRSSDHLVGARGELLRHCEGERLEGTRVQDQQRPLRASEGQVPGMPALEDLVDVLGREPKVFPRVLAVGD